MVSRWAESALSWWEEAGVDTLVGEAPRDWLAGPKPVAARAAEPAASPPAPLPAETLPDTLPAFQAWLAATDAIPFASPNMRRAAPAGDPVAGLMAITDLPSASGELFGGEAEALVDRMLAATGLSRDSVYLAPFSPIRPPSGRIDKAGVELLTRAMRHHIGLVAPRALLIFGDGCARALLGTTVQQGRGRWHEVETAAGPVKAVITIRPQELLTQPKLKAHAWADLQLLMEGLKA